MDRMDTEGGVPLDSFDSREGRINLELLSDVKEEEETLEWSVGWLDPCKGLDSLKARLELFEDVAD